MLLELEDIMGRVYEALSKGERASVLGGADEVKDAETRDKVRDPEAEGFDFVPYSLETPSLTEIHRIRKREELASDLRTQMARPSRTVELDQRRCDHRLTPSYECGSRISEEFNRAAIAMISAASEHPIKKVLITAADHGSGKTLTAINLAFALASARKRVLLMCTLPPPLAGPIKEGGARMARALLAIIGAGALFATTAVGAVIIAIWLLL